MSVKFRDYYEILGAKRDSSAEEIKQAYRRLAKQYHPDLHPEKDRAAMAEKFKEINEAYEVLSDSEKRAKYDRLGADWQRQEPAPGPPPAEGFSEFFHSVFGEARPLDDSEAEPPERDIEAEIAVSLEDAIKGGERRLALELPVPCPRCGGLGRIGRSLCPVCGGIGEMRQKSNITVTLPKGLREGGRIRLKGQGVSSVAGAPGDLYLRIRLLPHPAFKVVGADLETKVRVAPWDAALGGEAEVATPEAMIKIRIPAGSRCGRRLRIAGKGLPKENSGRGDLFAIIEIDLPDSLSAERLELFRKLKQSR